MKSLFRWLTVLPPCATAGFGDWCYHDRGVGDTHEVLSYEGALIQTKEIDRLEGTAFYINTIARTKRRGS